MDELPKIGAPATRALASAGVKKLKDLTRFTKGEIIELHGMGPKALGILEREMKKRGWKLKN
jgi:hypothetical protein